MPKLYTENNVLSIDKIWAIIAIGVSGDPLSIPADPDQAVHRPLASSHQHSAFLEMWRIPLFHLLNWPYCLFHCYPPSNIINMFRHILVALDIQMLSVTCLIFLLQVKVQSLHFGDRMIWTGNSPGSCPHSASGCYQYIVWAALGAAAQLWCKCLQCFDGRWIWLQPTHWPGTTTTNTMHYTTAVLVQKIHFPGLG